MKDAPLERVSITLPLAGSYDQLVGFLAEVERSPRSHGGRRHAAGRAGRGRLQVEISAYFRVAPGELEAARGGRGR